MDKSKKLIIVIILLVVIIGGVSFYAFHQAKENKEMMYEAVWNSSRVAVSLSADPGIMGEGLMGKELSEKPDAIENLTEFLLSI